MNEIFERKFILKIPFKDSDVKDTFNEYPDAFRGKLLGLRKLIFAVGTQIPQVGEIKESLKWGEPSYEPSQSNIGIAVRIHWLKTKPDQFGMYFNCNTNLLARIRAKYPNQFNIEGKRALIFKWDDELPLKILQDCIVMAFTYHLNKNH